MRISDWSSDVCSSDLRTPQPGDRSGPDAAGPDRARRDGWWQPPPARPGRFQNRPFRPAIDSGFVRVHRYRRPDLRHADEIGRASCRERVGTYVEITVVAVPLKKKNKN